MEKREIRYALVEDGIDEVFDERGNTILKMAEVSWNDRPGKLELRKWMINSAGELQPNKGFSFLTEDGPNDLVHCMLKHGYGDNKTIKEIMESRGESINVCVNDESKGEDSEDYYDPKFLLED